MTAERLHYLLVKGLLADGVCPSNRRLAEELQIGEPQLEELFGALSEMHGVVLHPHVCEPWVVHPFSLTPTLNWVENSSGWGWWSPCIWCAFGVAVLAGGEVAIHTRAGAESAPLVLQVKDGEPLDGHGLWVHFAIPPARAWNNVHQHCSLVLPFHTREDVARWCSRHGVHQGEPVPLSQVAALARIWYGRHADPGWKKWTVAEAEEIFQRVGLRSDFWRLGAHRGRF